MYASLPPVAPLSQRPTQLPPYRRGPHGPTPCLNSQRLNRQLTGHKRRVLVACIGKSMKLLQKKRARI